MEVHKRTPHEIFNMPQRLLVPLFQRPYVWSEEKQWEPLWSDITRVAERQLANPHETQQPHFIGAVVLQQLPNSTGAFQERTIIDGQQRLTTLQILLDAMHAEFDRVGAVKPAKRLERLIRNDEEFCSIPSDEYKVWPTNRDRPAFCEVMSAPTPVDYQRLEHKKQRLPMAHQYFADQTREWLADGPAESITARAEALEHTARSLLQVVVIDLAADENAQEIFETLNARGAQLSAADLIKNFIFQRLLLEEADTEAAYELHWKQFETSFWEQEVSIGRLTYPRAAVFLNHFLVARTGELVSTQEVFSRFKTYALHDCGLEMSELLRQVHSAANLYETYTRGADRTDGEVSLLEMFSYRMNVLETDSIKPLVLFLLDPELPPISETELNQTLQALESFVVRRMVVSASTKNYNQLFTQLLNEIRNEGRERAGQITTRFLSSQNSEFRFWPDDDQVLAELRRTPLFKKRRRVRIVLEALEDYRRGFGSRSGGPVGEQRVTRGKLTVEHLMPQSWESHWPLGPGEDADQVQSSIHLIGNLTLLTSNLNSKVSNGPWLGEQGKRAALAMQSTLRLNYDVTVDENRQWNLKGIVDRTGALAEDVLKIWPAPPGHKVILGSGRIRHRRYITVSDLIAAGLLEPGTIIRPTWTDHKNRFATVLSDGTIETDDGVVHRSLSGSGKHITKTSAIGGWGFWGIDTKDSPRRLVDLRDEYVEKFEIDIDALDGNSESDD